MPTKSFKPTTPSRRHMTVADFSGLDKVKPEKSLLTTNKKNAGRNNYGRITVRHQGGGNRQKYRVIDFRRDKMDMPAKVLFIEFCKEHPVYYTVGGGTIHIRPDQLGKEIDMLKEDPNGLCWMNLFSLQDVNQGYSETNPDTSFSAPGNPDIVEAKCKFTQNPDGSMTGLAYFKKKDGTEGCFKMKATRKANWSD